MYTINFDDLTKACLVNALEQERLKWQNKILQGDTSPGALVMHEQLYKTIRGILYARKKEVSEDTPQDTVS